MNKKHLTKPFPKYLPFFIELSTWKWTAKTEPVDDNWYSFSPQFSIFLSRTSSYNSSLMLRTTDSIVATASSNYLFTMAWIAPEFAVDKYVGQLPIPGVEEWVTALSWLHFLSRLTLVKTASLLQGTNHQVEVLDLIEFTEDVDYVKKDIEKSHRAQRQDAKLGLMRTESNQENRATLFSYWSCIDHLLLVFL